MPLLDEGDLSAMKLLVEFDPKGDSAFTYVGRLAKCGQFYPINTHIKTQQNFYVCLRLRGQYFRIQWRISEPVIGTQQ